MSDIYLSITETPAVVTLSQPVVSGALSSTVTVANVVSVSVVTMPAITVQSTAPSVTTVSGSVTVNNFPATQVVSVSNLPATTTVTGTVALDSASLAALENVTVTVGAAISGTVTVSNLPATQTIAGTVTANVDYAAEAGGAGQPNNGVQIGFYKTSESEFRVVTDQEALPISGTVTANAFGYDPYNATYPQLSIGKASDGFVANDDVVKAIIGNEGGVINTSNPLHISGAVTVGAMPNGSLTTRFGTPTTANTAFATSAVTNTSRKYLLIQNVTTASNVITVGIGFTPTTTQGIQLTAGAGITFESSYIPTGAVQILSSVTASNFTILEA